MEETNQPVNAGVEVVAEPQAVVESTDSAVQTDVVEVSQDKPQQSKDENSKYAAARREAEKKASALEEKIKRLEGLATKGGYESVESFAEAYERQLSDYEEQQRRERLESQGIDPDIYEQMIQDDPVVKKSKEIVNAKNEEERIRRESDEFIEYFESTMGRQFDPKTDKISDEVKALIQTGIPLVLAYKATDEANVLKAQIAEMKAQMEAQETNKRNALSSTGSVNPSIPTDVSFISKEVFEANKSNQKWVISNLEKLTKSRPKW